MAGGNPENPNDAVSLPEAQMQSVAPSEAVKSESKFDIEKLKSVLSLSQLKDEMGIDGDVFSDLAEALPFPEGLVKDFNFNDFAASGAKDALAKDILAYFEGHTDGKMLDALSNVIECSLAELKAIFSGVYAAFIVKDLEKMTAKGGKYEKIGEFLAERANYGLRYIVKDKKVSFEADGKDFENDYQQFAEKDKEEGEAKPDTAEPKVSEEKGKVEPEPKAEAKKEGVVEQKDQQVDQLQEKVSAIKTSFLGGMLKFLGYDKKIEGQEHTGFEKIALGEDVMMSFILGLFGVAGFTEGYDQLKESLPAEIQSKLKPLEKVARDKERKKQELAKGKEVKPQGPVEKTANEFIDMVERRMEVPAEGVVLKEDTLFTGNVLARFSGDNVKMRIPRDSRYLVAEEKADFAMESVLSTDEIKFENKNLKLSRLPKGTFISAGVKFEKYEA